MKKQKNGKLNTQIEELFCDLDKSIPWNPKNRKTEEPKRINFWDRQFYFYENFWFFSQNSCF